MQFFVMTLFPEMVREGLNHSIIGRAIDKGIISVRAVDIRDYTLDRHLKTDDYPFGGGPGMVMQVQPVYDCFKAVISMAQEDRDAHAHAAELAPRLLYMSPGGRRFDQTLAKELALEDQLIFLCGHYEGIDERVIELTGAEEVSLGDFVVTGGELPAMVMIDCISRLIPGVLGGEASAKEESFTDGLLEYPQYSRPEVYEGLRVPEILLSGDHARVDRWRREQSLIRTLRKRPDLIEQADLSREDREFLEGLDLSSSLC